MKTHRANYIVVEDSDDALTIKDVGSWDVYLSVTNDAENVVKALLPRLNGRRLFYYDSDYRLDELLVENGRFAGFSPMPAVNPPEHQ